MNKANDPGDSIALFQEALEEVLKDIRFFVDLWQHTEDDTTAVQYGQDVVLEKSRLYTLLENNKHLLH